LAIVKVVVPARPHKHMPPGGDHGGWFLPDKPAGFEVWGFSGLSRQSFGGTADAWMLVLDASPFSAFIVVNDNYP